MPIGLLSTWMSSANPYTNKKTLRRSMLIIRNTAIIPEHLFQRFGGVESCVVSNGFGSRSFFLPLLTTHVRIWKNQKSPSPYPSKLWMSKYPISKNFLQKFADSKRITIFAVSTIWIRRECSPALPLAFFMSNGYRIVPTPVWSVNAPTALSRCTATGKRNFFVPFPVIIQHIVSF